MATPILGIPELEAAQGQKYLTVNQALQRLDALVNLTVFNRTQTAPPGSPAEGIATLLLLVRLALSLVK